VTNLYSIPVGRNDGREMQGTQIVDDVMYWIFAANVAVDESHLRNTKIPRNRQVRTSSNCGHL
jgi:hypothetical protein